MAFLFNSSFLISFPLPGVSVIGWPKCFLTNDLYDFGSLDKLPRKFFVHYANRG